MNTTVEFPPSLWADITPHRALESTFTGIAETDVAIIRAGFTGLSATIEVARRGPAVTVLEGMAVGWGASGRNNGQVIPTLTAAEPDDWVSRFGTAGERMAQLISNSATLLFELVREFDIEAEAEQTGWFQPAHSPGRVALSRKRAETWQRFRFPAIVKTPEECAGILGSDFWYGGMFNPTGEHINPLALVRGMANTATSLGATIYERSPLTSFKRVGSTWVLKTPAGTLNARALILATNAYTGELSPSLAPRLVKSLIPVTSWQMSTEAVGDNLRKTILPGRPAVSDTRGDLRFFRYDARNRLITGGAVVGKYDVENRVGSKDLVEPKP